MRITNKDLKKRILEISYKNKLAHIGSCLTAVDIIDEIFSTKKPDEKFVLSSGHAGLALYVVLEKHFNQVIEKGIKSQDYTLASGVTSDKAERIFAHHGVHPDRCVECGIDCSSGSLGHGLGIALGMALADRTRNVYCLVSDGECAEGSIWEAMRIKEEQKLDNLKVECNWNGYAAYKETRTDSPLYRNLPLRINCHYTDLKGWPTWLQGQQAHYAVMDEKMYKEALEVVK